jgi:hypothetical protein
MLSLAGHTEICSPTFKSDPQKILLFLLLESLSRSFSGKKVPKADEVKKDLKLLHKTGKILF